MKKYNLTEFSVQKREKLLDYKTYEFNFDEMLEGLAIVRRTLSLPKHELEAIPLHNLVLPLEQRAFDSLTFLVNCYSGGHDISELRAVYPAVLNHWLIFFDNWVKYQKSPRCSNSTVAAIPLSDTDFVHANQLVCFGILLGWGAELHAVAVIIDFNNPRRDGMLERLIAPYVPGRGEPPDETVRHLPYLKTLKIFDAPAERRSDLMSAYLKDWYDDSRRERYYNSHRKGTSFKGYWAWEAAAITYMLALDDSAYADAEFYSADLVRFARSIDILRSSRTDTTRSELREKSGQECPRSGIWETLDIPLQRKNFVAGEIMNSDDAGYGITAWRYVENC